MLHLRIVLILLFFVLNTISVLAQEKPFNVVNISPDGAKYIKFGMNLQVWGRYSELNPGSKVGTTQVD